MVKRKLKRGGLVVLGLVVFLLLAVGLSHVTLGVRLNRTYSVLAETVPVPSDEVAIERGRRLVVIGRCTECHGERLSGKVFAEDAMIGQIYAPNLTAGRGGVGATYTDADWIHAIRHGIGPDGRTLLVTPAKYYNALSDEDLGAMLAYLKQLPPVDNPVPDTPTLGPLGRTLVTLTDPPDWLPAEKIDHDAPRPPAPPPGPTVAYGAYLWQAATCGVCHTPGDLWQTMDEVGYDEAALGNVLRRGWTPDYRNMNNDYMPWRNTRRLTDEEVRALWRFLQAQTTDRPGGSP